MSANPAMDEMAPRHCRRCGRQLARSRDRPDDEELSGQSLRRGPIWQASVLAFPPFRLHLTQLLDCTVEITLQFRLVASHALKGTPRDSLYLKVIDFLVAAVL